MSPTMLGEYCARCAMKSIIRSEGGFTVYVCPRGHGIQAMPEQPEQTETATLQWPVAETDTDIALTSTPTTVVVGSMLLVDSEYMTVTDVSNLDNPGVARGALGSAITAHAAGAEVKIWGN
jgi:hypothetical protein